MKNETFQDLKNKVETLEKSLLAITSINDIQMQNQCSGNQAIDAEHTVFLLDHILEPTMYQVEALRELIHSLQSEVVTAE